MNIQPMKSKPRTADRALIVFAFIGCALITCTSLRSFAQDSGSTLKVDVKLVNMFVTVTDTHGAPVASLEKDNFQLKENGKDQKIAVFSRESALPLSIALSIDTSLSTRKDLPLELASARKFSHTILRPQDGLAVYKFSEEVDLVVPFTSDL
jgi:Ca-activated chloride channel family protein